MPIRIDEKQHISKRWKIIIVQLVEIRDRKSYKTMIQILTEENKLI